MAHANARPLLSKRNLPGETSFGQQACAKVSRYFFRREHSISMSTGPESRLRELGIALPAPPEPGGNYVPAKTVSHMVYLSGVVSADPSGLVTGAVGLDRTIEEGYAAARLCALTQLAV